MTKITQERTPDLWAYNECVNALNDFEAKIEELVRKRDGVWVAADAISPSRAHGAEQRKRNLTIKNGYIQR